MTSYRFSKMALTAWRICSWWFGDVSHLRRSKTAYQLLTRYLNPRLRYYYFRFWKRTVAVLKFYFRFPLWRFTVTNMRFCVGLLKISSESDHPRQSYDIIAIFKMAAVSHVGFALVGHPRSVIDDRCFILKFRLDRISSFGNNAIFTARRSYATRFWES